MIPQSVALFTQRMATGAFSNLSIDLAKGLREVGVETVFLAYLESGPPESGQGIRAVPLGVRHSREAAFRVAGFLRRARPDVLISMPSTCSVAAVLGWRLSGRIGTLVVSEHATMSYKSWVEHRRDLKLRFLPMIARWLYPLADGLHAVSEGVMDDLIGGVHIPFAPTRRAVIGNAVDPSRVNDLSGQNAVHPWLSQDRTIPVGVAAGSLVRQKNYELLIDVVAKLATRRRFRVIIVGDGPRAPQLKALVKSRDLGEWIDFVGHQSNPYPLMKNADVFLLTSEEEGFGLVVVEAMLCGVPIVATRCVGPAEILGQNCGLVTPVGDPDRFAAAVDRVLDDGRLRRELVGAATLRAKDFAPRQIALEWLKFLGQVSPQSGFQRPPAA